MSDNTMIDLCNSTLLGETEKAWHIEYDNEEHWFPKSICEWDGDETITVPQWIIKAKKIKTTRR